MRHSALAASLPDEPTGTKLLPRQIHDLEPAVRRAEEAPGASAHLLEMFEALRRNVAMTLETGAATMRLNADALSAHARLMACKVPNAAPSGLLHGLADKVRC